MRSRLPLLALTLATCFLSARSCGPDFAAALFVQPDGPDGPYDAFAAGQLGVLRPGFRTRSLMVAWDWMIGRPLTKEEQADADAVDTHFDGQHDEDAGTGALDSWINARNAVNVPLATGDGTVGADRTSPTRNYASFTNCLDDAYRTAARTLKARVASYGANNPDVLEWVRGQDMVFANCAGGEQLPPTLTSGAPWLLKDRAYQMGAAQFYAMDYDRALITFRSIAADASSPWSVTARFLEARTLIRKATVPNDRTVTDPATTQAKSDSAFQQGLEQARTELLAMQHEPRMQPLADAIERLLDFVNLRLDPNQQAIVLAARLAAPHTRNFEQSLIDLSWLRANFYGDNDYPTYGGAYGLPKLGTTPPARALAPGLEALQWMQAVNVPGGVQGSGGVKGSRAIDRWRATRTTPWLVAAMMQAQPGDTVPDLLAAAKAIPPADPAYLTVTYHRLRLGPPTAETRAEVLRVSPIAAKIDASTTNLFLQLDAATAPTMEDWLRAAARPVAAETSWDAPGPVGDDEHPLCSAITKIKASDRRLFDDDAAYVLNQELPLRLLAEAAASDSLPRELRYQVAQAAWVRALLLDRPEIAAKMSPLLIDCRAAWKPFVDAYDHAAPGDREPLALLALMRFASTEPSVRSGEPRRSGFATYDDYRQNWWCLTVPGTQETVDDDVAHPRVTPRPAAPPAPPFLSAKDLSEASGEVTTLSAIPNAATYFGKAAIAWTDAHPHDPHNADLLGEALRVERNSCGDKAASEAAHQVFLRLQQRYPNSEWAKKYKTWE